MTLFDFYYVSPLFYLFLLFCYSVIPLNNIFLHEFMSRGYLLLHPLHKYSFEEPILFIFEQFEQLFVVLNSSTKLKLHPFNRHLYINFSLN